MFSRRDLDAACERLHLSVGAQALNPERPARKAGHFEGGRCAGSPGNEPRLGAVAVYFGVERARMELVAENNLFSFFYERVQEARRVRGVDVEEDTEFYLVNLLVDFLRTRRLVEVGGVRVDEVPLAIRLLECRSNASGEGFVQLKHLADSTLYVLGFFAESLHRSSVDLSYYRGLAQSAYRDLSLMGGWRAGGGADSVFDELSDKFSDCALLLGEVREGTPSHQDILALYERYLETGDPRLHERLRSMGILPEGDTPSLH